MEIKAEQSTKLKERCHQNTQYLIVEHKTVVAPLVDTLCNPLVLHKLHVIKYGSRTLIPAERNYHLLSGNLNFLELKW